MSYEHLLVAADGPITTVTLNRVDQRNALSLGVMRELTAALTAIARRRTQRQQKYRAGVQRRP